MRARVRDFLGGAPLKLVAVVLFAILLPSVLVTALGLVALFEARSFVEDFRHRGTDKKVRELVERIDDRWGRRIQIYRSSLSHGVLQEEQLQSLVKRDPCVRDIFVQPGDQEEPSSPRSLSPAGRPDELRELERLEFASGSRPEALAYAEELSRRTEDEGVRVEALLSLSRLQFRSGEVAQAADTLERVLKHYGDTVDVSGTLRSTAILSRLLDLYSQLGATSRRDEAALRLRSEVSRYGAYLSSGARERLTAKYGEVLSAPPPTPTRTLPSSLPTRRQLRMLQGRPFVQPMREDDQVEIVSFAVEEPECVVHLLLERGVLEDEAAWVAEQVGLVAIPLIAKASGKAKDDDGAVVYRYRLAPPFSHLELSYEPQKGELPPRLRAFDLMSLATFTWSVVVLVVAIIAGVLVTLRTVLHERRTARLKTDFVSFISHELKTPLTSIRLYSETLLDERVADDGEKELCVRMIDRESKRLASLIDQILQYSQFERHQKEFLFTSCNMEDVVRDAVRLFKEHDQVGRVVEINAVQRISKIRMDRAAIIELLLNFIGNAAKYSPKSESITINLRESIEDICVDVVDHGVGIRKRDQKKIFDKFYRAEDYLTRDVEGTGLGLTFARYIAKVHNGEIKVSSQLNGGSTFTLQLRKTHVLAE